MEEINIENALLGTLLLYQQSVTELYPIIREVEMEADRNQIIFDSISELADKDAPVDLISVMQTLKSKGELEEAGGMAYITGLTVRISQPLQEYHAFLLKERHIKKKVFEMGAKIMSGMDMNKDIFELLAELQTDLEEARSGLSRVKVSDMVEAVGEYREERREVLESDSELLGCSTGIRNLDKWLKGYRKGKVTLWAARPAMGKTVLAMQGFLACGMGGDFLIQLLENLDSMDFEQWKGFLNMVLEEAKGDPAIFYTYEMPKAEMIARLVSMLTGLDAEIVSTHGFANTRWQQWIDFAEQYLEQLPLFIEIASGMSGLDIKAVTQRYDMESQKRWGKPLYAIFIDYLQLMSGDAKAGSREQEVAKNAREMKLLAMKGFAVVEVSQLSRAVETRGGDKRPMLSDLRESGAIEQDADIIIFPYRPEYYGIEEDEEGNSTCGICEIGISKYRGGRLGREYTKVDFSKMRFTEFKAMQSAHQLPPPSFNNEAPF